jgi:hypothetical protein
MSTEEKILNPPSNDAVGQTAYAVQAIREAVGIIHDHYTDMTAWPGWSDDAGLAVRLASQLLMLAADEATA